MSKVYIVSGDHLIEKMFLSRGVESVSHLDEAELVCFTGGADVTPSLYGEKNVHSGNDWLRDVEEVEVFKNAQSLGIPCVGICRGGQFLNVMNGGKMWQDVDNHAIWGTHEIGIFTIPGVYDEGIEYIKSVTSTHHQMMRAGPDGVIIGFAELATKFVHDGDDPKPDFDTEIVWYEKTRSLCFQPHPEYNGSRDDTEELFFKLLKGYGVI